MKCGACQKKYIYLIPLCDSCLVWYLLSCTGNSKVPQNSFGIAQDVIKIVVKIVVKECYQNNRACNENQEVVLVHHNKVICFKAYIYAYEKIILM